MSMSEDAVRRIGVREFHANLSDILQQAHSGSTFLVTSGGEVLAELRPPSRTARPPRQPGTLRGEIHMADDFDLLPPEEIAALEQ